LKLRSIDLKFGSIEKEVLFQSGLIIILKEIKGYNSSIMENKWAENHQHQSTSWV